MSRSQKLIILLAAIGVLLVEVLIVAAKPLRVHPFNSRYFTDGGDRAIYLTGSHTWNNLREKGTAESVRAFDYVTYLDFLQHYNHNFIRLWAWEHTRTNATEHFSPSPYQRTGPGVALDGKPKFDVTRFDQSYFDRLRARVRMAGFCFVAPAIYVAYGALSSLLRNEPPEESVVGILLAIVSLIIMPLLARAKRCVALNINNGALRADAKQTEFCTYLSAIRWCYPNNAEQKNRPITSWLIRPFLQQVSRRA